MFKMIYDELFLIVKECVFICLNFKVDKYFIEILNVFVKIMGVLKDNKEYWNRFYILVDYQEIEMVRSFLFIEEIKLNY